LHVHGQNSYTAQKVPQLHRAHSRHTALAT